MKKKKKTKKGKTKNKSTNVISENILYEWKPLPKFTILIKSTRNHQIIAFGLYCKMTYKTLSLIKMTSSDKISNIKWGKSKTVLGKENFWVLEWVFCIVCGLTAMFVFVRLNWGLLLNITIRVHLIYVNITWKSSVCLCVQAKPMCFIINVGMKPTSSGFYFASYNWNGH